MDQPNPIEDKILDLLQDHNLSGAMLDAGFNKPTIAFCRNKVTMLRLYQNSDDGDYAFLIADDKTLIPQEVTTVNVDSLPEWAITDIRESLDLGLPIQRMGEDGKILQIDWHGRVFFEGDVVINQQT